MPIHNTPITATKIAQKQYLTAAKTARKQYLSAYGKCVASIIGLMKACRLKFIQLDYDILEPRCFNVGNVSGGLDTCVIVEVALDEDGGLVAYSDSGTRFPLGDDENGQDNYTLANLDFLVYKAVEYVEAFQKRFIRVQKPTKAALYKALKDFLKPYKGRGENGIFLFEDGFTKPRLKNNEPVTSLTFNEGTTLSPDGHQNWFWLKDLSSHELRVLVDAINEHILFKHNYSDN